MTTEPNQTSETVSLWSYTPSHVLSTHEELNNIYFRINDKEPLVLTKDGFTYNGEFIEDAGKAYQLFMEVIPNYLASNYKNVVDN